MTTRIRIYNPHNYVDPNEFSVDVIAKEKADARIATSWYLPAWVVPIVSQSVKMSLGDKVNCGLVLSQRLAHRMGIQDGQEVEIMFVELGHRIRVSGVGVVPRIKADAIINGMVPDIIESFSMGSITEGQWLKLSSGPMLNLQEQKLWCGVHNAQRYGNAVLYFDGASRTNPIRAGYGFYIVDTSTQEELVRGYGYGGAAYSGLIEGLDWAVRLNLEKLTICGVDLIMDQIMGKYNVKDSSPLKEKFLQASALLKDARDFGTDIVMEPIPGESNKMAHMLANLGIDLKENVTAIHWDNVNTIKSGGMIEKPKELGAAAISSGGIIRRSLRDFFRK